MCSCGAHVEIGGYQNAVGVEIPPHMKDYKEARVKAGLTPLICLDRCVEEEIKSLWESGIKTYGSCCGHNVERSMVNVSSLDFYKMLDMEYIQWADIPDGHCKETFYLKSCGKNPL